MPRVGALNAALFVGCLAGPALAEPHYVSANATGADDGSSWADAWSELDRITGLRSGDTVEVGTGTYGTRLSIGADDVVVRRTLDPAHAGPVTIDSTVAIGGNNVTLDGSVSYGILIERSAGGYIDSHFITGGGDDVTLRNLELDGPGWNDCHAARGVQLTGDRLLVDRTKIHDFSSVAVRYVGGAGHEIRDSVLHNIRSAGDSACQAARGRNAHFEHVALFGGTSDVVIQGNIFSLEYSGGMPSSVAGGFGISIAGHSGYLRIYNNVFFNIRSGVYLNSDGWGAREHFVANGNTFVGFRTPLGGHPDEARNNIFCNLPEYFVTSSVRWAYEGGSHNLYCYDLDAYVTGRYQDEVEAEILEPGQHPFVEFMSDWTLTQATQPGVALMAPYDRDFYGVARGEDGVWDRGAFEHRLAHDDGGAGDGGSGDGGVGDGGVGDGGAGDGGVGDGGAGDGKGPGNQPEDGRASDAYSSGDGGVISGGCSCSAAAVPLGLFVPSWLARRRRNRSF